MGTSHGLALKVSSAIRKNGGANEGSAEGQAIFGGFGAYCINLRLFTATEVN